MMNKRVLFYGVILLQALFLLIMTASYYAIDAMGEEIRLKTVPVDPRDIFYGDYVVLQYEISTISKELWVEHEQPEYGERVYVVLEKEGEYHHVASISLIKPELGANETFIQGRYLYDMDEHNMYIEYGIERYFVPEGTGKAIENSSGNLEAYIKMAPWGQLKIDRVSVIGE
jgi:uncharacterized membrane-anchored protein